MSGVRSAAPMPRRAMAWSRRRAGPSSIRMAHPIILSAPRLMPGCTCPRICRMRPYGRWPRPSLTRYVCVSFPNTIPCARNCPKHTLSSSRSTTVSITSSTSRARIPFSTRISSIVSTNWQLSVVRPTSSSSIRTIRAIGASIR